METTRTVEDWAWDIYVNGIKSKWVHDRVIKREDFRECSEYDEYMELARGVIKIKQSYNY